MRDAAPPSRRTYTIVLSLVATGILIAGVSLRPKSTPAPVRSETEFLQLQLLSQRRDLQRRSIFFQTQAERLVTQSHTARAQPERYPYTRPEPGTTVLLVTTDSSGQPVWATATTAGSTEISCNGRTIEEIETTITVPSTLVNATAFDLDENLAGFVIPCGERRIVTSPQGFQLASQPTLASQLEECCGIKSIPDPATKRFEIAELDSESRLAKAGARTGDLILEINRQPVETEEQLAALLEPSETVLSVQRVPSRRPIRLTVPALEVPAAEPQK